MLSVASTRLSRSEDADRFDYARRNNWRVAGNKG